MAVEVFVSNCYWKVGKLTGRWCAEDYNRVYLEVKFGWFEKAFVDTDSINEINGERNERYM
jgi:hypothetical protein